MDYLKDFKWAQRVPDDKDFISDEKVLNESVSFKILRNAFHNPLLESSSEEDVPSRKMPKNIFIKKNHENIIKKKITNYIPGLCSLPMFPQKSQLSPDQHKICTRVIQSQNNYCITMPQVSIHEHEQQIFNNLIPIINEERKLFMEHVKNIWLTKTCGRHLKILDEHELLIEYIQKKHKNAFKKYPRYYQMATMLPLVYSHDIPIELKHMEDLLEINQLRLVKLPSLKRRFVLPKTFDNLIPNEKSDDFHFKNNIGVVSEDNLCEDLALKSKAHIVISSNGLKILADSQPPFSQFWDLPIFIKEYKIKDSQNKLVSHSVVYIDRSIPICKLTNKEKSFKCFKHLLKSTLTRSENFDNQYSNEKKRDLKLELSFKNISDTKTIENSNLSHDEDENFGELIIDETYNMDTADEEEKNVSQNDKLILNTKSQEKCEMNESKTKISSTNTKENKSLVTYKLWKIGQVKGKKILSKDLEDDIKVIVRCKIDGYETDLRGIKQTLNIVPKIEYQNDYGSEMNTSTETAHHWTLLKFRPQSKLIKARIIANKGEIMMIEKLPLISITNEAAKQNLWRPEAALGCYFNIFSKLSKLQPGQYILRHDPKNHAFAILYSSVQSRHENGLDLHENYECVNKFLINQTAPWTPIDPYIVTPNLAHHNVMPCMFTPGNCKVLKNTMRKKTVVPIKKKSKKNKKAKNRNDK